MKRDRDLRHWAGIIAACVGASVLAGWLFDIGTLKSILPGWVTMKANTAAAFFLTGLALLLSSGQPSPDHRRLWTFLSTLGRACGLLAGLIGLITLGEYVFGWSPGIDQWLFTEAPGAVNTSHAGRMAPDTALCFALLAAAVELARRPRKSEWTLLASAAVGAVVTAAAASAILVYVTPTLGVHGWWGLTMMAAPTAGLFAILGASITLDAWHDDISIWSISRAPTIAFLAGLALLVFIGLSTSRSVARLSETNRHITRAVLTLQTTAHVMAEMAEAQAHTRGYVITGDARYLGSQREAMVRCRLEMDALRQLISSGPSPLVNSARLAPQVNEALLWFPRVIDAQRKGMDDDTRRQLVNRGEDLVDDVRKTIATLENEEGQWIENEQQESQEVARQTHAISFAGSVAGLVIFLSVLLALNRAFGEHRRNEAALRETNEYLDNLFNYANAPIIVWDPRFLITRFNHAFELLTGRSEREVIGSSLEILFPPELVASSMKLLRETATGERMETVEIAIQHRDGSVRTVLWNSATLFAPDGTTPVATIAQGHDITVRKRAEAALRTSEEQFRMAAETANDVVYAWDLKQSVHWLGKIDEILGYEPGEFPRTLDGWAASVHPEDLERTMAEVQASLEGRAPYEAQYRVRHKDGSYRWWSARGAVARTPDGKPVRWIGSITDITDRTQTDEALRESESRFRQLAESLPQLVWTCQPDGPCDYLNSQWIEFTGVPEAQQLGFGWLEQLHPDDRAPTVAAWEEAVAAGSNFHVEFRIRRHDGEYRWFDTQAVRLRDAEGHTVKWFGSNTDMTERKRAEEEISELNADLEQRVQDRTAQLEAANKELEAFSYSVSHDLRAPLRGIDGWSHALLEDCGDRLGQEGRTYLNRIRAETQQMGSLIEDMTALARLTVAALRKEQVDMSAMVRAIAVRLQDRQPQRRAEFVVQDGLFAVCDPRLVEAALSNLLDNAFKFTGRTPGARIEFGKAEADGNRTFFVRDNGVGFEIAEAKGLFRAFQRFHKASEFPGTGVGLATVARVVQRHGGRVWAEAAVNRGATFYFTLEEEP